jgi:putative tricarboxylic transport membrane protein
MTKDRAFSLTVLIFVAVMYTETYNFPEKSNWEMFSTAFYPRILLGMIGVLSLIQLLRSFKVKPVQKKPSSESKEGTFWSKHGKIIGLFLIFGLYVFLLPIFGFILATILYLFTSQAILMGIRKPKLLAINSVVTLGTTGIVYQIFTNVLRVWLP